MLRRRSFLSASAVALVGVTTQAGAQGSVPRARTLVIAQNFDPQTLWPNGTTATDNVNAGRAIVESLFWRSPQTGKIEPLLGESFSMDDPTTVRVTLRKGVKFTNGEPMNADAVVHAVQVFMDPKVTPAYAIYAEPIAAAERADDATVLIRTKFPYPAVALMLTQIYVTPPAYWASAGAAGFGQKPIGTGPFQFTEWQKDNRLVMDRNPTYWGKAAGGIDRIVWRPVPDDTARAAGLQTGEYDVTSALSITDVAQLETNPDLQIIPVPSFRIYTVSLSSLPEHPGPLHDKRVRQALNYAVDKESLVRDVLFGRAQVLDGQLLRPDQIGFDPAVKAYPYDPVRAKTLLAEAGYPNGFEVLFKYPSGRYPQDREVSEAIAGMLAKVGVRTTMMTLEPGEFLRQLRARELAPMAFVGLAPPDDPDYQMSQYRSTWRYAYVQNPAIDALIDAGAREMDPAARAETYQKLAHLMHEEAPVIFLYQGKDYYGAAKHVSGWLPSGDQQIFLYDVTLVVPR